LAKKLDKFNRLTPEKTKLLKQVLGHLNELQDNEAIPFFQCFIDSADEPFPNLFIAKWNRNAYGGCFVHIDPDYEPLTKPKLKWVTMARDKGYACTVIDSLSKFKEMVECYKYSCGLSGKSNFQRRYEREKQ